MANLALIRGAAMAAPKFTDIRAAVEPGIRNFKTFASMMQKEKEKDELEKKREDEIKFNLYANLPGLEDELVPEMFKGTATQKALEVRNQQKALINNKENMDQYEFIDQMKSLNKQVAGMNKDFSAYKEWSANWVDLKDSDDLSSGMSANDRKQILDVLEGNGKPVYTDEGIGIQLENGEVKMLNNLPKVVPIAHDKHRDIQNSTLKVAEALGSKGIGSDDPAYINRMNTIISDFKRGMSSQDALSLGADFLKTGGQLGEYAGIIKKIAEKPELVETMTFNDRDEFGKVIGTIKGMEGYKEFIADQYALIAKTTNDSLKEAYDKKTAPKPQQGRGLTAAQLLKEQKENRAYADRAILASQDLRKVKFDDINTITVASGGVASAFEKGEKDSPYPNDSGVILNGKIPVLDSMTDAQKMRQIISARVENGMLDSEDVPNLLASLKITSEEMQKKALTASELLAKYQ